jgi:hypothetical protein
MFLCPDGLQPSATGFNLGTVHLVQYACFDVTRSGTQSGRVNPGRTIPRGETLG